MLGNRKINSFYPERGVVVSLSLFIIYSVDADGEIRVDNGFFSWKPARDLSSSARVQTEGQTLRLKNVCLSVKPVSI